MSYAIASAYRGNADLNKLSHQDRAVHDWYRFVLSFPPHLVRQYLERFNVAPGSRILDPFCGTGTTAVESRRLGLTAIGIEGNPMAHFAAGVKTEWEVDPAGLMDHANRVAERALNNLHEAGISDEGEPSRDTATLPLWKLREEQEALLLKGSISPLPLHKALVLLESMDELRDERFDRHERLAFAKSVVATSSNLHFGPEVGVGAPKPHAAVVGPWLGAIERMVQDLWWLPRGEPAATILQGDARRPLPLAERTVDAVFCSPPYPNEKDYTRTTRLESVLLGFVTNKDHLRALKKGLLRSNTRGVYKEDVDDAWVSTYADVQRLANEIEARRLDLGKTSGFERMYARVVRMYFGGMARHLAELRPSLKPGARLAYVVGDQASFFQVLIRTGSLLGDIADSLGYRTDSIDLFRTRLATATRAHLREEVLVLTWPGRTA